VASSFQNVVDEINVWLRKDGAVSKIVLTTITID
jgi:hypothetical protein